MYQLLQCPVCRKGDMEMADAGFLQCANCRLYFPEYKRAPLLQKKAALSKPEKASDADADSGLSAKKSLTQALYDIASKTPFSPHFAEFYFIEAGEKALLKKAKKGVALEIGCGDKKVESLLPSDCQYIGTDYLGWGEKVNGESAAINDFAVPWRPCPMIWADGARLPFKDGAIDTLIALQTLEHIPFIGEVFFEAGRVLKEGGCFLISIPWFFRLHGGEKDEGDYGRYTKNAIKAYAEKNSLLLEEEFCNTSFLQAVLATTNQYLVRIIFEKFSSRISHLLLGILFAPVFFVSNMISLVFQGKDRRWALCYFFVLRKQDASQIVDSEKRL